MTSVTSVTAFPLNPHARARVETDNAKGRHTRHTCHFLMDALHGARKAMNLSPFYDEIKARAEAILADPEGWTYDGLSQRAFFAWKRPTVCRAAIDEALCMARDELHERVRHTSKRSPWTVVRFNAGNFLQAKREIVFKIQIAAARAEARRVRYTALRP